MTRRRHVVAAVVACAVVGASPEPWRMAGAVALWVLAGWLAAGMDPAPSPAVDADGRPLPEPPPEPPEPPELDDERPPNLPDLSGTFRVLE